LDCRRTLVNASRYAAALAKLVASTTGERSPYISELIY